jgi:hypothetical protein
VLARRFPQPHGTQATEIHVILAMIQPWGLTC